MEDENKKVNYLFVELSHLTVIYSILFFFQELIIFGRDVSKVPCFRSSFLYGITGGLALGLVHFLFTSKSLKAVNFSVYSFSLITIGYWVQCRYYYATTKFEMLKLKEIMRKRALTEGSEDPTVLKKLDEV